MTDGGVVDGFRLGHVPVSADATVTDFTYAWEDVGFTSRVWERPTADGGWRVVLQALVLRGEKLRDLAAVRVFLSRYHERVDATWDLALFTRDGRVGLRGTTEAFWWAGPGVAVEVRDPLGELGTEELVATARSVTPVVTR
ncbi:hypothetical protein J4H86_06165 [Spiractinospora alimapuensis]|uniref:hypothetical protein n=1 Tax=Spiractinospora alimapuensis TaxID=2820884 RepID=UPI001F2971F8|nr:hypothetical protein [Spiractinospora alimapuensis]QVQ53347.1 hypothetical protein J4H86_06165 [Spiractinospora alimapuensis]